MRILGGSTLRGGQTVFHGIHMWSQLMRAALLLAVLGTIGTAAWRVWDRTTGYEWYASAIVTFAEAKLGLGYEPDTLQRVRRPDGTEAVLTLPEIAGSPQALAMREKVKDELFAGAAQGAKLSAGAVALLLASFWLRGRQLGRNRRIRGAERATVGELRRRVRSLPQRWVDWRRPERAPYRIAGVPYPHRAETRHTIVSGTTGAGKTVLISDLVSQVRERGERCVVYDKMGSYTRAFFDPARDVLLNPLDARSPRWSPFYEARGPGDFDTMAAALIPQQKDTVDPFWVTAARQLFANGAGVLRERGVTENRVLVEHLLKTDLTRLAEAMEGTVAQSIVDPENPKTALSVRAMLTANIGALEYLRDSGEPFSIRDWISNDETHARKGCLFLTSRGDQHASLRGLISTWLEIAVNAMLSLEQDDERRIWVVLDELPTLNQVPSLQPGLAESRQFGGCFVLGIQVISALRDLYGRNGAETISGLCGTRVVLAAPDRDTAEWSAESLGRAEVEEMTEGFSYGASTIRDGVSLMPKRELRPLALGSEIMRLENLHGWLRFPGPLPVARIRLEYEQRPKAAERFVPRPEDAPKAPASADAAEEKPSVEGERKAPLYREDVLLLPPLDPDEGSARSAGKPLASRRKPQKRKTGPIRDQKRRARAAESREGATGEAVNPGTRKRATAPAHRASPSPVPARDKKGGGAPEPGQRASSDWL